MRADSPLIRVKSCHVKSCPHHVSCSTVTPFQIKSLPPRLIFHLSTHFNLSSRLISSHPVVLPPSFLTYPSGLFPFDEYTDPPYRSITTMRLVASEVNPVMLKHMAARILGA